MSTDDMREAQRVQSRGVTDKSWFVSWEEEKIFLFFKGSRLFLEPYSTVTRCQGCKVGHGDRCSHFGLQGPSGNKIDILNEK
jgi:hypothetical protein